jgi:hypothetical protein
MEDGTAWRERRGFGFSNGIERKRDRRACPDVCAAVDKGGTPEGIGGSRAKLQLAFHGIDAVQQAARIAGNLQKGHSGWGSARSQPVIE